LVATTEIIFIRCGGDALPCAVAAARLCGHV